MKAPILLAVIAVFVCTTLNAQDEQKRGEPVEVKTSIKNLDQSTQVSFVYPGCYGHPTGMEVSPCLTNMLNRDLKEILKEGMIESNCESVATTLKIKVDDMGVISLTSVSGENLPEGAESVLSKAVDQLNGYHAKNGDLILPATIEDLAISVEYEVPFVIKGDGYSLFDTFNNKGTTYNVYRSCNNFFVKEAGQLNNIEKFDSEQSYQEFKNKVLSETKDSFGDSKAHQTASK